MATKTSKASFGSKENISAAVESGLIDEYDIIYMTNGEIAWQNASNETIVNTPRTQNTVEVEDITVAAGSTMDEAVQTLAQAVVNKITALSESIPGEVEIVEF